MALSLCEDQGGYATARNGFCSIYWLFCYYAARDERSEEGFVVCEYCTQNYHNDSTFVSRFTSKKDSSAAQCADNLKRKKTQQRREVLLEMLAQDLVDGDPLVGCRSTLAVSLSALVWWWTNFYFLNYSGGYLVPPSLVLNFSGVASLQDIYLL